MTAPVDPENVRRCVASAIRGSYLRAIEIQTHQGNQPLGVSEIWEAEGVLHISVFQPEPAITP